MSILCSFELKRKKRVGEVVWRSLTQFEHIWIKENGFINESCSVRCMEDILNDEKVI